MFILAYQDFCLSAFLPIIIFATCKSDFRFPFYFLADFLAIFLQSFSKILSSENQKPNTKSLPKAENQTKCCKTIFQKSAESQKCSNNKKTIYQKPKMKQRDPNLCNVFFCLPSQMFSGFQWQNTKQKSAEKIKIISIWLLEQYWLFLDLGRLSEKGFTVSWMILADFW